jgi:hypothetical protein
MKALVKYAIVLVLGLALERLLVGKPGMRVEELQLGDQVRVQDRVDPSLRARRRRGPLLGSSNFNSVPPGRMESHGPIAFAAR